MTQKLNKIFLDEVESTNTYLLKLNKYNSICYSFNQVAGRGRHQTKWLFEKDKDLAFSLSLKFDALNQGIEELNLKIILSLLELLDEYHIKAQYKVPNDIYVNGAKICGVLIERYDNQEQIVIGIGVNVNSKNHNNINSTSIYNNLQSEVDLEKLVSKLTKKLLVNINKNITNLAALLSQQNILYNKHIVFENVDYIVGDIDNDFCINLHYDSKIKKVNLLEFTTKNIGA